MKYKHNRHVNRRNVVTLVFVVLAFCIVLPRLSSFRDSINTLRDGDFVFVGLSILAWLSTFFAAALVYTFISLRPLPYARTLLVQLASGFTNRLAPLGAGIVTLNMGYLVKRGHTTVQAGAVVALNNFLGFVGMAILLLGTVVVSPSSLKNSLQVHLSSAWVAVVATGIFIGLCLLVVFGLKLLRKIERAFRLIMKNTLDKPMRVVMALLSSMTITAGYTTALYTIGLAFNVHLSIPQALFVLTLGVAAGSVSPTPGGIGGAEIGLVAALISVGITPHQALTTALMYRFLTYWLPIVPGFICLQIALRKRYI